MFEAHSPFKAGGGEDENMGLTQQVDDILAYDVSGASSIAVESGKHSRHAPNRLTFTSAYALVVGSIIGAGIFASPSRVDSSTPSPGVAMLVWLTAGLIAWAGAIAFAELGSAIPRNGGMQEYLRYIYGDLVASVMSRTFILASKPTGMAILSIVFAEYWTTAIFPTKASSQWVTKPLAVATVLLILMINCISATISTRFTNVLLFSKLTTVALVLLMALLAAAFNVSSGEGPSRDWSSRNWFETRQNDGGAGTIDWTNTSTWDLIGHLTSALYAALWAFSGYDGINYVTAEMQDPSRDLPRVIYFAMPTVLCCYTLINMANYIVIPWNELSASKAIAVVVGNKTLGPFAGLVFAILISISVLGVMNIETYIGGILAETAARHGYMPRLLARSTNDDSIHYEDINGHEGAEFVPVPELTSQYKGRGLHTRFASTSTPIKAMLFNTILALPFILFGSFKPLVTFSSNASSLFYFLTVSGGLMLRFREPSLKRPYRPNFLIPAIFCVVIFLLFVRSIILAPLQGLALLLLVGLGSVLHLFRRRFGHATGNRIGDRDGDGEGDGDGDLGSPLTRFDDER